MLYISSSTSSKTNIKDAVIELVQLGFLNIELGGGTRYYDEIENDLLELKEKYKINFLIHNYFPPAPENFVMNIASRDRYLKDDTFNLISNAIRLAKRLGSDLYTLHPGLNRSSIIERNGNFYEKADSEKERDEQNTKEDFYKAIDFLIKNIVCDKDIKIGIENLFPIKRDIYSYLDSEEDILEFLNIYREKPNVGLLLDLGHLNVASKYLGFNKFGAIKKIFTDYPDKVFEIHVSENEGIRDSHQISQPTSWQIECLRQNKGILNGVPIVFEWRRLTNSQAYQQFTRLKKILDAPNLN